MILLASGIGCRNLLGTDGLSISNSRLPNKMCGTRWWSCDRRLKPPGPEWVENNFRVVNKHFYKANTCSVELWKWQFWNNQTEIQHQLNPRQPECDVSLWICRGLLLWSWESGNHGQQPSSSVQEKWSAREQKGIVLLLFLLPSKVWVLQLCLYSDEKWQETLFNLSSKGLS